MLPRQGTATARPEARPDLVVMLDTTEAAPPDEGVDALATELAARFSASEVSMLITDISGLTLARLARRPGPGRSLPLRPACAHVPIAGTPAGTALVTQRAQISRDEDGVWVHVPASERGEAVGVLELLLAQIPSAAILDDLSAAGHTLAYVIIADRRFNDLYEIGERSSLQTRGRDPASSSAGLVRLRRTAVRPRRLAHTRQRSRR